MSDLRTQDADGCYALLGRFRERLGYIPLPALRAAAARGELYATDAASAYVWHRRDGVTTLHAIASEERGHGARLMRAIVADSEARGQHTIRARCPVTLAANLWYAARGFALVGGGAGQARRAERLGIGSAGGMKLVYCAGGNPTYMALARSLGWWPGVRSDDTIYDAARPLYLLDCHWTACDWPAHLAVAMAERPALAAVPDVLTVAGLPGALAQAEMIAPYCGAVMIIPKARVIPMLPRHIGGAPVTLGYSVPSKYGVTPLPVWEFSGWPVHLLGGTPRKQIELAGYLDVVSADGNMAQKIAHRGWVFDERGHGCHLDRYEPRASLVGRGMPARALGVSLRHIADLWRRAGHAVELAS